MTDYAPWLRTIATHIEQNDAVRPCHKALRRAADKLDSLSTEGARKDDVISHLDTGLERATAEGRRLETALQALLNRYVELVNWGDCGSWDPEKEDEVIAARAALLNTKRG